MSAYLLVSLQAQARNESKSNSNQLSPSNPTEPLQFSQHKWWDFKLQLNFNQSINVHLNLKHRLFSSFKG